ncbi:hypothetical protein L596_013701 [Steinernema carpocapsae]|uniref:Uncharacterized protein n=1 Tax=Steinernema carpocapsae TaxID=34508 RepID=A0A4U5P1F4_STECR|nr:hypothetical protein L596_013701 [Steinernema carpocapsae]
MSSGKITEAALLEITENMTLEDLLTMRLLSIWIQQIVDRSIRERGLAPIKVIMHRNKDVLCKGNEKIGLVLAKTIREKEELEEDDYLPVPFATIEVFITGLDFNPTDARMADAVKVLGLRSARKLSKVVLKFGRAQLSPQLLEVLRLMGTKPLEALVLEWYSADATYNENLQSDLEALESLFRSLRATLKLHLDLMISGSPYQGSLHCFQDDSLAEHRKDGGRPSSLLVAAALPLKTQRLP